LLSQTLTRVKTMYASLHSNCAAVRNFSRNLGVVVEVKENCHFAHVWWHMKSWEMWHVKMCSITLSRLNVKIKTLKVSSKMIITLTKSFSLRGTHKLYLSAVQTQHRGRPGIYTIAVLSSVATQLDHPQVT